MQIKMAIQYLSSAPHSYFWNPAFYSKDSVAGVCKTLRTTGLKSVNLVSAEGTQQYSKASISVTSITGFKQHVKDFCKLTCTKSLSRYSSINSLARKFIGQLQQQKK